MLSYTRRGAYDAPLVVLLHGGGTSSWMWHSVIDHLSDLDCLAIDLPGHGESRDIPWKSISDSAHQVWELIDWQADTQSVHIIGLSLGAYVGLTALAQRPHHAISAVLSGLHAGNMGNKSLMKALSTLMAPIATKPFLARKTARMFGNENTDIGRFVKEAGKTRISATWRATNQVIDFVTPENMQDISTRTLVVAGEKEHDLILSSLDHFSTRMQNCRAARASGLGHGWAGQDPELFAEMIRAVELDLPLPAKMIQDPKTLPAYPVPA